MSVSLPGESVDGSYHSEELLMDVEGHPTSGHVSAIFLMTTTKAIWKPMKILWPQVSTLLGLLMSVMKSAWLETPSLTCRS